METIEFRTSPDGTVYYKTINQEEKKLTRFSKEVISPLLEIIKHRFPQCYARLFTIYPAKNSSIAEISVHQHKMVERFVRCNFGEHDLLTQDIEHDMLHFEEVRCPLRGGYCKHENIICRPKGVVNISPAERVVVSLYLDGMTFDKISHLLHKSPSTIKTQLLRVKQKLKVKNCREIIRIMRLYNY